MQQVLDPVNRIPSRLNLLPSDDVPRWYGGGAISPIASAAESEWHYVSEKIAPLVLFSGDIVSQATVGRIRTGPDFFVDFARPHLAEHALLKMVRRLSQRIHLTLTGGEPADRWIAPKRRIQSFAHLEENWDGHGSPAIGGNVIAAALRILDAAAGTGIWQFGWAGPTSEEGILIQLLVPETATMKLEVDRDGDIGIMVERPEAEPEFFDVAANGLPEFFTAQEHGGRD